MPLPAKIASFFQTLFRKKRLEDELNDELGAYIDELTARKVRSGQNAANARREALMETGGLDQVKEEVRANRVGVAFEAALHDIAYAWRNVRRKPGLALAAILTLALGIGANTAIFSAIDAVLLRPLPYPEPDQLYSIEMAIYQFPHMLALIQDYREWRNADTAFASLAALTPSEWNLTGTDEPERVGGAMVSPNFFSVLKVAITRGREFTPDEEDPGKDRVVVISDGLWRRRFAADPQIAGRTILLNGQPHTIIGVAPASLLVPTGTELSANVRFARRVDVWKPWAASKEELAGSYNYNCAVLARLKPGENSTRGAEQLTAISTSWQRAAFPNLKVDGQIHVRTIPIREVYSGNIRFRLFLLMGSSALLLLIACSNIANLFLAHVTNRSREFAARIALGASRSRIVMQMLTESTVVALLGGVAGAVIAYVGCDLLIAYGPTDVALLGQAHVNLTVLLFAVLASIGTGLLCGFAPAWHAYQRDVQMALKKDGRNAVGARHAIRLRQVLIGIEIAVGTILLVSTGLLLRSFVNVLRVDRGYQIERVLALELAIPEYQYTSPVQRAAFYNELEDQIRSLPGVLAAGSVSDPPTDRPGATNQIYLPEDTKQAQQTGALLGRPIAAVRGATAGYFAAAEVVVLAGQAFQDANAGAVAVISESLAKGLWPGQPLPQLIGRQIRQGVVEGRLITVIGIVRDVRSGGLDLDMPFQVYRPHRQRPTALMTLLVRTAQEPEALASAVRAYARKMDPNVPVPAIRTMKQIVSESVAQRRFQLVLTSLFAVVSLLLAAVGLYGVVSYSVAALTKDIGIRIALGAKPREVLSWVLRSNMRVILTGLLIGLAASIGINFAVRSMLFEVTPADPLSLGAVALILLATSALACYLPARRAAGLDPLTALRDE